jgi:outer membrane receptor protein involved in Fe transport
MNSKYAVENVAAAIRLRKAKRKLAEETAAASQQQQAAEERQKQQQALEQQAEESRRDSSTMEEQVKRNPDGILARFERERKQKEEATKKNL